MNYKKAYKKIALLSAAIILSATSLTVVNAAQSNNMSKAKYGRIEIQNILKAEKNNVYDAAWSPDLTKVLYIKQPGDIYLWKIGESSGKRVKSAEPTTTGFTWSPDSKLFLINVGHMGPGNVTSQLMDSTNLNTKKGDFVSISAPVWSPDGKYLAMSSEDEAHSVTQILIYSLDKKQYKSILKVKEGGGPIAVKYWDKNGNIEYTENDLKKGLVNKTIKAIKF